MIINSTKVSVAAKPDEIVVFLEDANNILKLLPEDKVTDFEATKDKCSFKVQGGVIISLVQDGKEGNSKVFLKSGEKSPFPFKLTVHINEDGDGTIGYMEFNGEVNTFLKMMVEKPLTNLFNLMTDKLKEQFTA